jgi:hypothetical protein
MTLEEKAPSSPSMVVEENLRDILFNEDKAAPS